MSTKSFVAGAFAVALVIQALFFSGYYYITSGCLCSSVSPQPPPRLAYLVAAILPYLDLVGRFGYPGQVGDLSSTLERLGLNFLAWGFLLSVLVIVGKTITMRLRSAVEV
jgi:hypothetical protein